MPNPLRLLLRLFRYLFCSGPKKQVQPRTWHPQPHLGSRVDVRV